MPINIDDVVVFSTGGAVGYLTRTLIDHRLAKSRDKESRNTKDFNEAADIMADVMRKERDFPSTESNIDFFAFRRVLSQNELSRFDRCIEKYKKAKVDSAIKYDDENSVYVRSSGRYQDPTSIISAIDELLEFTKRK